MLFNSLEFLIFFPIVFLVYGIIPKKIRYMWLLLASCFFYMCWNPYYMLLMLLSIAITYASGRFIEYFQKKEDILKCKIVVFVSFATNLGILAFFKYSIWLIESIGHVLNRTITVPYSIVLPVGISFYTFQALGYTVDVYRKDISAEKNFFRYALFVSFFPQLVAGPIERSKNLLNQLRDLDKVKVWNYERVSKGIIYMMWGFFLKLVIADRVAILVNTVFDNYVLYGTVELIAAAIGFAIQIYCDFGSYSIIAIGAAKIIGVELMENFLTPYFSKSIKEFWRRWHVSLSSWLKDYLYIPLGGNRCTKVRKYVNLLITFLVSGLWHGANWTYVAWGGIHGVYQIIESELQPFVDKINKKLNTKTASISYRLGQAVVTFILVDIAWIFFRADSITNALNYIVRIFTRWNPWALFDGSLYNIGLNQTEWHILIVALIVLLIVSLLKHYKNLNIDQFLETQCSWFRYIVVLGMFAAVIVYGIYGKGFDSSQFIYFQF